MTRRFLSWVRALLQPAWHRLSRQRPWGAPTHPAPPPVFSAEYVEDEPDVLHDGRVYFVGGRDPIYAAMACPCACGAVLRMNLRPEADPCWLWATSDRGAVTLKPSVWHQSGCRSHFFLHDGRVDWCD